MAGDNRSFPYQQLRPEHEEVRLLVLQPAAALEDPIACEIQVVSLRFNPQYDAISYVWGAPGCRGTITLSARPFTIFENLEAALKRLRKKAASRVLWIDAVCINQNDNDEKVFQIPLMRRIYEQAEQVCIWLGEASEGSSLGMRYIKSSLTRVSKNWELLKLYQKHKRILPRFGNMTSTEASQMFFDILDEMQVGEVRELFDRPWWTRVWIMQEAIVAKKLLLMCGKDTACWTDVDRWVKRSVLINGPKKQYEVFGLALNPDFQLMNGGHAMLSELRQKWHGNAWDLSIYELLYKFRRLNCTNPKDRIYGFLGLVEQSLGFSMTPNYAWSTSEVYTNAARMLIEKTGSLDILNCKREWQDVAALSSSHFAYSFFDQVRYHATDSLVDNSKPFLGALQDSAPRPAWVRLPPGWERQQIGDATHYYDWNCRVLHDHSPYFDQEPQKPTSVKKQCILPLHWEKVWSDKCQPVIKFCPAETRRRKALMHPLHTELSHLPSWVPNWAIPTQWDPEPLLDWSNSSPRYWASGSFHQNLILTGDRDKLCLEGVNFDTIMELANPWHPDSDIPPASRKGLEVLKSWEQLARWPKVKGCPYTSAQGNAYGRQYATWRTHIADYAGQNAAPAEVSAFIECWYDRIGWATDIPNPDAMDGKGLYERYKVGRDVSLMDVDMILHLDELRGVDVNWMKDRSADTKQYGEYAKRIHNTCAHRALFVTQKGYIGLAPWNAKLGDLVFLLRGGKTPFILRRQIMVDGYSLVGESYVYGIMSGEGWKMGLPLQRIELI